MDVYSLGQFLRETRESRGLELAQAVDVLRIRQPILEAFEAGDFSAANLSDNQVRGMLRNYARYLSLDEEHVLRLYDDAKKQKSRRRWRRRRRDDAPAGEPNRDAPLPMQEIALDERRAGCRARLWRSCALLLFSILALGVIAFVTLQLIDAGDPLNADAASTPTDASTVETTPLPSPTPLTPSATPSDRALFSESGIMVSILVTQRGWIRLSSDGVEVYAGIAPPGTLLEHEATREIRLSGGNALGLDIIWNGQQQPALGGRGQQVDALFTLDDIIVALGPAGAPTPIPPTNQATAIAAMTSAALTPSSTPGPSPTPSRTPIPSATSTFTPAPTLTPSETPLPSPTPTITMTPTATAILPPRVTQAGLIPPKERA